MENKKQYHHGDLKSQLISCGSELLRTEGYEKFSLRKVAALAKVSHTAVYRHYENKDSLVSEISRAAWAALDSYLYKDLEEPHDDLLRQLKSLAHNYMRFSIENHDILQVLFYSNASKLMARPEDSLDTVDLLEDLLRKGMDSNIIRQGDPRNMALIMWSTFHGLTSIVFHRNTNLSEDPDRFIDSLIDSVIDLLRK